MGDLAINANQFTSRLKKLKDSWQGGEGPAWAGANTLAIAVGGHSEDLRYLKSISLHVWLFGYELPGACGAAAAEQGFELRAAASPARAALRRHYHGAHEDGAAHPDQPDEGWVPGLAGLGLFWPAPPCCQRFLPAVAALSLVLGPAKI